MKDSGIEWIGQIPEDWEILSNKYLMKKLKIINEIYKGEDILSLTKNGVIVRNLSEGGKMPASFDGYQVLKKGNLLFCLFDYDVTPRTIGKIDKDGISSPAYSQYVMTKIAIRDYYYYFYLLLDYTKELLHLSKNLRSSFSEFEFGLIEAPVPKTSEQIRISDFLDKKTEQIENTKSTILQEIQTLEEYKKSIITEAVTKGLDKNVEMKDSGIEWIGEIPKHWKLGKIKNLAQIFGRIGYRGYTQNDIVNEGEGAVSLSPSNMCNGQIIYNSNTFISWEKYNESPEIKVEIGDILMVKTGSSYGKVSIVKELEYKSTINPQLIILKTKISGYKYIFYWMNSKCFNYQVEMAVTGGTIPTMSQEKIKNFLIVMPSIKEQEQIISYLNNKTKEIDEAIESKQKQLETLEKYKKSLIYEYVTGKKEVE